MAPEDRAALVEATLRFVSWLRVAAPEVAEEVREGGLHPTLGAMAKAMPVLFWGYVGDRELAALTRPTPGGESVLDRVVALARSAPLPVRNEILVGFVEGHMFPRPDSPLAREMGAALGEDLSDLG